MIGELLLTLSDQANFSRVFEAFRGRLMVVANMDTTRFNRYT